jgi:arylsulfatase A-like enzyme
MNKPLDRREFLKMTGLFSLGLSIPPLALEGSRTMDDDNGKNILIVVYDAFSALNTDLYRYPRASTPNLNRLADKAVVYHNHIAGGNYTTPGTASLLTGVYPWTHRAFSLNQTVIKEYISRNIFHAFPHHHRLAYTHNPLANTLLAQLALNIDDYIPPEEFFLLSGRSVDTLLKSDEDITYVSWVRAFERSKEGHSYSLFLSHIYESLNRKLNQLQLEAYQSDFPRGVPDVRGSYFLLEDATDYLQSLIKESPKPFVGYFHFYPPHAPYATRNDFFNAFAGDGYKPVQKPEHFFTEDKTPKMLNKKRREYDEYLLYVDAEFGRLYDFMESSGLLEDTWLILTSDHGEMFERGILGHTTPAMSQPLIHIPLMIFEPGRTARNDVYQPTSAVDILPTLLQVTGNAVPDWCEGVALPPFSAPHPSGSRGIYSMDVRGNFKKKPLHKGSLVMVKEPFKLNYYYGLKELAEVDGELIELFDIYDDPEELRDLYAEDKSLAADMLDELKSQLAAANRSFS